MAASPLAFVAIDKIIYVNDQAVYIFDWYIKNCYATHTHTHTHTH